MKRATLFAVVLCLATATALAAHDHKEKKDKSVTGWVADSHCAARHAKPGGEKCVAKCIEGGAKMVLVTPDGDTVLTVSNPEKLAGQEGKLVKVSGKIDREAKTIEVASAEPAEAPAGGGH